MILEANHIINSSSLSFILFIWSPVLPSSLCNNHLRANLVEPFPQVWSLQVHAGLLPGAGHRRRAHSCGLRALQQRVLALCCTGGGGRGEINNVLLTVAQTNPGRALLTERC